MQTLLLSSYRNSLYSGALAVAGYRCIEYPMPVSAGDMKKIRDLSGCDIAVFEADCDSLEHAERFLETLKQPEMKICISDKIDERTKLFLIRYGISDLLISASARLLLQFIKSSGEEQSEPLGSFVILDDNEAQRSILRNIISRFRYLPVFVSSLDEMFKNLGSAGTQFVLINLEFSGLDLKQLIRRSCSSIEMKRIPVLAYRDMSRGLFVHEIISGLNRITHYILSPPELFSFLLELLYRKEITPYIQSLSSMIESSVDFSGETLSRIYFTHESELFRMKSIADPEHAHTMLSHVSGIRRLLSKIEGLRWMMLEKEESSVITCGLGASV